MAEPPNSRQRPATILNDLPESLLIYILTLLPLLSAIKASFISRQWRNLWHFIPSLQFILDDEPLFSEDVDSDAGMANSITQVLFHRPKSNPLTSFRLDFIYSHPHRSFVTAWIRYALDCKVEDMSIFLEESERAPLYQFHFFDVSNRPVRCLRLCLCEIVMPLHVDSLQFDSLRLLYLALVSVNDEILTDLISRCRNLETLDIGGFSDPRKLKICSKSLKVLKLNDSRVDQESSIEIHAPNLSKIRVLDFYAGNYAGDLSSVKLVKLVIWNSHEFFQKRWGNALNSFRNVESLKIEYILPRYVLPDRVFQFERLKHLEVQAGYTRKDSLGVFLLLERAPALQTLVFTDGVPPGNDEEGLPEEFNNLSIKPHIPSLREVKIVGFRNTVIEYWILLLFRNHGVVLNKVVLVANSREPTVVLNPASDDFLNFLEERRKRRID